MQDRGLSKQHPYRPTARKIMLMFVSDRRIKDTQLDYSVAHKHLLQSSRKAPQNSAAGFRQHVAKLSVTVELLLGNIPER